MIGLQQHSFSAEFLPLAKHSISFQAQFRGFSLSLLILLKITENVIMVGFCWLYYREKYWCLICAPKKVNYHSQFKWILCLELFLNFNAVIRHMKQKQLGGVDYLFVCFQQVLNRAGSPNGIFSAFSSSQVKWFPNYTTSYSAVGKFRPCSFHFMSGLSPVAFCCSSYLSQYLLVTAKTK